MNDDAGAARANPIAVFRHQLDAMGEQFAAALPRHIPVERFTRVVMTAVQQMPELLACERRSLWNAALKCAQDGLLPDGREAAMVIYEDKRRGRMVQYLPMIAGIRKKVRNSGEIATWDVYVVHERDEFDYELGDNPFIRHKPTLGEPGKVVAAYSVCTLKTGEKSREVMSAVEIEKVRAVSRAGDTEYGPWRRWYEEMCRKTVARRHSKVLPMSSDLDDLMRRDDALYDFAGETEGRKASAAERPRSLAGKLDMLAAGPVPAAGGDEDSETVNDGTGEIVEAGPRARRAKSEKPSASSSAPATGEGGAAPADAALSSADVLRDEDRAVLRAFAAALALAESEATVQRGRDRFFADHSIKPGSAGPFAVAARAIADAHLRRVRGEITAADADDVVRKASTG